MIAFDEDDAPCIIDDARRFISINYFYTPKESLQSDLGTTPSATHQHASTNSLSLPPTFHAVSKRMNPNDSNYKTSAEASLTHTVQPNLQQPHLLVNRTLEPSIYDKKPVSMHPTTDPATSQLDAEIMGFGPVTPTFEPLKVCLDDDSSIEDGDEDMFDDDAFYFGDEDFQALLSRVPTKMPIPSNRISSSALPTQNSSIPLHHNAAPPTTDSIGISEPVSAESSATGGLPSSGPSSSGETRS